MHRVVLVGVGKVACDQHLPAIAESISFELAATVTPDCGVEGVQNFSSFDIFLESGLDGVVVLCVPPAARAELALAAITAGYDVLLEKPPAATLGEGQALVAAASRAGATLFVAWHSRFAPAVTRARGWLQERELRRVHVTWREDVRRWHPGQQWIWEPGGFGVFDAGINALSLVSDLVREPILVRSADLVFAENGQQPIAVTLRMSSAGMPVTAEFDWRAAGDRHDIVVDTDRGRLTLADGGAAMRIDGEDVACPSSAEYPALYRRFAELLSAGESDTDLEPLRIVADAYLLGRRIAGGGTRPA